REALTADDCNQRERMLRAIHFELCDRILVRIGRGSQRRIAADGRRRNRIIAADVGSLRFGLRDDLSIDQQQGRAASAKSKLAITRREGAFESGAEDVRCGAVERERVLRILGGDPDEAEGVLRVAVSGLLAREIEFRALLDVLEYLYLDRALADPSIGRGDRTQKNAH